MPSEAGDPEETRHFWIPTNDEAAVGRQGSKSSPSLIDAHPRKGWNMFFDFFRQQLLHGFIHGRIARRKLLLITGAKEQSSET